MALIGVGVAAGVGAAAKSGIESLALLEDATTSVSGAIAQLGIGGQITAAQVAGWANEIESDVEAAFDDKDIVTATATLIRFGKVVPSNLRPAMEVMTDLAVKTGSVESASTLLAKALADPAKAAGKLARSGVILTKAQEKQIKAHMKAGRVAQAQKVILDELTKTTEGAAKASAGPYRDSLNILADVTEDAQRALGEGFLPVITKVSQLLRKGLGDKKNVAQIREFGKGLASGLDSLIEIARNLPWAQIGDSLKLAGAGAKTVLGMFSSMPPWVQTAVLTGWGLNKLTGGALGGIAGELGKGLIKGVLGMNAGVVNIKAGVVTGAGGVPAPGAGGGSTGGSVASKVAIGATIIGGVALSAESIMQMAEQNAAAADRGLSPAEIAAQRYYNASTADQSTIAKRLGYVPTKADFNSGTAKLQGAAARTNSALNRFQTSASVGLRNAASASRAAGITSGLAAKNAGARTTAAIHNKRWRITNNITVPVSTRVTVSARDTAQAFYKVGRYGRVSEFG